MSQWIETHLRMFRGTFLYGWRVLQERIFGPSEGAAIHTSGCVNASPLYSTVFTRLNVEPQRISIERTSLILFRSLCKINYAGDEKSLR